MSKKKEITLQDMGLLLTPGAPAFKAVRDALDQYIERSDDAEGEVIDAACKLFGRMEEMSGRPAKPAPRTGPTTWMDRFRCALALLCSGSVPPLEHCEEWVSGVEVQGVWRLQEWTVNNAALGWATGIAAIEAAEVFAGAPAEGEGHLDRVS